MREIKFRAWDKVGEQMLGDRVVKGRFLTLAKTWELMQFTGLKDKNGKEIYEGDILALIEPEVKGKQSEFGKMLVKFGEYNTYEIESGDESIGWFMEGYHGYLRDNGKRDIYKTDSFDEHPWSLLRCKEWEIIGNIYENPELLK